MRSICFIVTLAVAALASRAWAGDCPNIVLIVADDQGWTDFGFMGHDVIKTPHLDRLARVGVRMVDHFTASPAPAHGRAGLLTGAAPMQAGTPLEKVLAGAGYTCQTVDAAGVAPLVESATPGKPFLATVNLTSFLLQLVVTSRLIRYMGVRGAMFILPVLALVNYSIIAIAPILLVVRIGKIAENATDYSIQNTLRQALFLPTTREAKYKAKAAIDTFFTRVGDLTQAAAGESAADGEGNGDPFARDRRRPAHRRADDGAGVGTGEQPGEKRAGKHQIGRGEFQKDPDALAGDERDAQARGEDQTLRPVALFGEEDSPEPPEADQHRGQHRSDGDLHDEGRQQELFG